MVGLVTPASERLGLLHDIKVKEKMNIRIDPEFKELIPPLTRDERGILEVHISREGCLDPIKLWGDIVVDGHNRYQICNSLGYQYQTQQMEFPNRDAVKVWIISNQFGRRNINNAQRADLALKMKEAIASQLKNVQMRKPRDFVVQNSAQQKEPTKTRIELAKIAGVSHDTIDKVEAIKESAIPSVYEATKAGEISINLASQVAKLPKIEQEAIVSAPDIKVAAKAHVANNSGNNEWYTPPKYIEAARLLMGSIDTDPASSEVANKRVNAKIFFTDQDNGLTRKWRGNVWMNPPYAQPLISDFCDAINLKYQTKEFDQAVILVNNATETRWFQALLSQASCVCFPKSRIRFLSPDGILGASPLQGQAVIYLGDKTEKFKEVFCDFGAVLEVNNG